MIIQKLYNEDESAYLEFAIVGQYDNSYDGTTDLSMRVIGEPQQQDITTYDTEGNPTSYAIVTIGTEPAHSIGYDGNLLTNEKLNAFFGRNDIDYWYQGAYNYTQKIKDNNGTYPYLELDSSVLASGFYMKQLRLVVGPRTYGHYAYIGLLNDYAPVYQYTNARSYKQNIRASEIYLGLPVEFSNLCTMLDDMGSDRTFSIRSTTQTQGKYSSTLARTEVIDNDNQTVGVLATRTYYNEFSGNILYNTAKAYIPRDSLQALRDIPTEEVQPNDDDTYNNTDGEEGTGKGPDSLPDGEVIDKITIPTLSPLSLGIYNIYKMTVSQFQTFKSELWNSTIMDYLTKIWQSDPMESILSLALAPFTPATAADTNITIGGQTLGNSSGAPLIESYVYHEFTLNYNDKISTVWGNKYDYDGVSYNLFVPFVGFQKLTTNDIYHKNLQLNYIIETLTGNGICYLYTNPQSTNFDEKEKARPTYTWSFNCYSKIPLSGRNLDQFITSVVAGVGSAMSGSLGGVTTLATARPTIQRSGELKANTGYMGGRRPFIVCEYSNLFIKNGQYNKIGRPAWRYTELSNCTGYTKCENARINQDDYMTERECNEIERLLNEGVIL